MPPIDAAENKRIADIEAYAAEVLPAFNRPEQPSLYEQVRAKLLFPLVPLRFFGSMILTTIPWNILSRMNIVWANTLTDGVISKWQRRIVSVYSAWLCQAFLFICGFRVRVHGSFAPRDVNGQWTTIISNHASYWDTLAYFSRGKLSFVAKAGLDKVPLFGLGLSLNNSVMVNRGSSNSRAEAKQMIEDRMKATDCFSPLTIFPEGTTTNNRYLIPFKTSAFEAGLPIQPCYIRYNNKHFKPYWTTLSAVDHIKRSLAHFGSCIDIHPMPVYYPTPEEKADPALYAANVRAVMSKASGMTQIDLLTRWKFAYQKALKGDMTLEALKEFVEKKEE